MQITCPAVTCKAPNDVNAGTCVKCGLPLAGSTRLTLYPSRLFNMGLAAAKENRTARARDLFAAVVYWCPMDIEARNALATTCYASGDRAEARVQWEAVLKQSPSDAVAARGLLSLSSMPEERKDTEAPGKKEKGRKNKAFKKKGRK